MWSRRAGGCARVWHALAIAGAISLGVTAPAAAETVVLNAAGGTAGDIAIRGGSYATANFEGQILATRASTDPAYLRRVLLKFDTESRVPAGAAIQSATLTLTVRGGNSQRRTLDLHYLKDPFDTSAATWKHRKSGITWSTAGGTLGAKYAEAPVTGAVGSKVTFDVTRLVQDAVSGRLPSRWARMAILDTGSSTSESYREFHSLEAGDPAVRPTLTVVYGGSASGSASASGSGSASGSSPGSSSAPSTSTATLPSGWSARDIGTVKAKGDAGHSGGTYTVTASGRDIWDTSDGFRFVYRTLTGDGEIVARVTSVQRVHDWTKAGVMMRESLNANSRHAFMLVSSGKGVGFQRRTATGGLSAHTSGGTGKAPQWVKLTRSGTTFRAYRSADGKTWTQVGSQAISMASTIHVGLAVTAKVDGTLAAATFTNVAVKAGTSAPPAEQDRNPPASASSGRLRVLHWNIHHGVGTDGKYNIDRLATWMADLEPDIVSLNEVERLVSGYGNEDQPARIAAILSQKTGRKWYHHFAQRYGSWSSKGQGNLLLSRYPLTRTAQLKLTCNRSAALIGVNVNGRTINVVSTHLDDASASCRSSQASQLLSWLNSFTEQRILAGDFNESASSAAVKSIAGAYVDAWARAVADKTAESYSGNSGFGATRNSRIDYVFHSKGAGALRVRSAEIYDTRDAKGKMPSDHKPLVVVYDLE